MSKLTVIQIEEKLAALKGWVYAPASDGRPDRIQKTVKTGSFLAGLGLVTAVAALAEKLNHHPDVLLTYPSVVFTLTTHDAGGVTEKDLHLAREMDALR